MASIQITKSNFEKEVMESGQTVLLDFWASWCGPCRMVGPIVEAVSEERTDIKVGKINVDEETELAEQYNVMSIPTLVIMKNGKVVKKEVGARGKEELLALIDEA